MLKFFSACVLLLVSWQFSAQDYEYQSIIINPELTRHANAVVRNEVVEIEIEAVDRLTVRTSRTVTVLNDRGDAHVRTFDVYDDSRKIKKQSAVVYDKLGKEIKKFKRRNFEDRSLVGSGTLISDDRVKFVDYIPRGYPYTIVYESEVESRTTIFLQDWMPIRNYHISVENSSYELINSAKIPFRFMEENLEGLVLEKSSSADGLRYSIKNLPAYRYEKFSPDIQNFSPQVLVALDEFSLVGVKGQASNWAEFGKWQYDHLLKEKNELSPETVEKIASLTADAGDDIEKARRIYQYVQDNTRYISVQLGIGGWEPMAAKEVDHVGYGDCKALTNYTRALLESQNIESYYAVVYGGEDIVDINPDFFSMQGNHVILNVPTEGEDVWLECTSQTIPFNYLGDFTDNRNVLLIKPEGGQIVKTKSYAAKENLEESFSTIELEENGSFEADVKLISRGVPYGNKYYIEREQGKDQVIYYKKKWGHLKDLDLQNMRFTNKREIQEFTEELNLTGKRYVSKAGNSLLLPLNFFIPDLYDLPRNENRKRPLQIARGRTYKDTFQFILPTGFDTESIPENAKIENDFGAFELSLQVKDHEGTKMIQVERQYVINEGLWPAESYSDFRNFMHKINILSNQKAVIVATNNTF